MIRTQIYITEQEYNALASLKQQTQKSQSELIREAIDAFCAARLHASRFDLMREALGMWKEREDIPQRMTSLRKELDRPISKRQITKRKKTKNKRK